MLLIHTSGVMNVRVDFTDVVKVSVNMSALVAAVKLISDFAYR
jgi:hypothetical protein